MFIHKGYRFRLDPSEEQVSLCSRTAGICRWLWNLALEQRSMAWSHGQHSVGFAAQCAELPNLNVEAPWVGEAPSHCLQQTLRDLDQAFQAFFAGLTACPVSPKKFQRDSFRFPDPKQFEIDEINRRLKLPKLGWVSIFNGKGRSMLKVAGKPKSITVSREGRRWYASVLCEIDMPEPKPVQGSPVGVDLGVDLGVVQAITLSTGEVLAVLGRSKAEDRKVARLQRALARKKKRSKNRSKARRRLAECHSRIARRRRDAIHKATTKLAKNILERGTAVGPTVAVCGAMPSGGRRNRNPAA
jgi:putative transposase